MQGSYMLESIICSTASRSISLLFFISRFAAVDPPLAETTKLCGGLPRRFWLY